MTNKERINIINKMLENINQVSDTYCGLCAIYSVCSFPRMELFKEAFPAVQFFARICGGNPSYSYWWQPGNWKFRIITLKMLKYWYKFKSNFLLIV